MDEEDPDAEGQAALIAGAQRLATRWPSLQPDQSRAYLKGLLWRVIIRSGCIQVEIAADQVTEVVCSQPDTRPVPRSTRTPETITLEVPAVLKRASMAVRLMVPGAGDGAQPDPSLMRLLRLSFLAPDIVAAILEGHQPPELTAHKLMRDTRLPLEWTAQRRLLRFA